MSYVLIIGAKSDIAKAVAREYAKNGYDLYLAARNVSELEGFKKDIEIRSNRHVELKEFDMVAFDSHQAFYDALEPKPLGVIVAAGYMVDQKVAEKSLADSLNTLHVNFTGCVSLLNVIANDFEKQKNGFIVGISSVAGDRGRKANYIYGSAKAGFSAYLSGLRNRLYGSGVQVLTVKPGFVNTKMTEGLELPAKLTAEPEDVAHDIFNAQQKGKNVLYTKCIWKLIMFVIKHIPEFMFKKMSI
ncbi:MAG: short-chain dehydrogenase [Sulfurovum sp. AS07-7]|nr:MAG: short-chain dehydrogenase [Sulfurovum sp. AS07-7]